MTKHTSSKTGSVAMVGIVAVVVSAFLYLVYRIISGRSDG
jgi:hypothetical protein